MTLRETLLPRLAEWASAGEDRPSERFPLPEHGWTACLTAERVDSVGCRILELQLTRDNPVAEDADALTSQAKAAASRVTGLMEPLRLVEVDRVHQVAMLRSEGPPSNGDFVQYYEVRFHGRNLIRVERIKASKNHPASRGAIAFALTHEVIAKLVEDLVRE
ncbi:MAG: hypothetical protein EXS09_05230 [Gemmataceae bacterium]|nr:hypothetical protein [Gemmataceae bacterium]